MGRIEQLTFSTVGKLDVRRLLRRPESVEEADAVLSDPHGQVRAQAEPDEGPDQCVRGDFGGGRLEDVAIGFIEAIWCPMVSMST